MTTTRRSFLAAISSAIAACGLKPGAISQLVTPPLVRPRAYPAIHICLRGEALVGAERRKLEQWIELDKLLLASARYPQEFINREVKRGLDAMRQHPGFDAGADVEIINYGARMTRDAGE